MDKLYFTEEHLMLRDMVREFAINEVRPVGFEFGIEEIRANFHQVHACFWQPVARGAPKPHAEGLYGARDTRRPGGFARSPHWAFSDIREPPNSPGLGKTGRRAAGSR